MLKELEGHSPSILPINCSEKGSCFNSKLFTQVSANLDSVSFDNHQQCKDDLSMRDIGFSKKMDDPVPPILQAQRNEQDSFQSNIYSKFQELQSRSSRVLNMFPRYQSRVFQGSGVEKEELEGEEMDRQMENKLKIIKDLEFKIIQLESNISSPYGCKEDMLNIEKEINLDFHNYYAEAKEIIAYDDSQQEEEQMKQESVKEQTLENIPSKSQSPGTKHPQPIRTSYSSYDVCILVPKLVEIEVPIPSLKIIEIEPESQQNPQCRTLQRSKSYSDKSKGSLTSIGEIIKQFNKNMRYDSKIKDLYTYQSNVPNIKVSRKQGSETSGFHLPLDSFERISKSDSIEAEKQAKLRPTDRSNISSTSQLDKIRDEFWNKQQIQFNQEHLSLVKETEQKSESNDECSRQGSEKCQDEGNNDQENQNLKDVSFFCRQLKKVREELADKNKELCRVTEERQQFQARAVQKQIQLLELTQKHEQLEAFSVEQGLTLQKERKINQDNQTLMRNLNTRITSLEKHLSAILQQKESEAHQFLKLINDKNEQLQELSKTNQEIKAVLAKKQRFFQSHCQEQESLVSQLQQQINFYREKTEEEGFRLNMEEAFIIRDLIQKKQDLEHQNLMSQYRKNLQLLKMENEDLKEKNKRISEKYNMLGIQYEVFEEKFSLLMKNYQSDLHQPSQPLPTPSETSKVQACDHEIGVIDSVINYMLSQREHEDEPSLNFIYAVSRIMRRLKFCETSLSRERIERERLTNKLKGLNLSVNREIEKVEERAERLYKENKRYKLQNQQLSANLRKSQLKLSQMKNQMESCSKLTSGVHEVEKEFLEMENRKINEKWMKSQNYISDLEDQLKLKNEDGRSSSGHSKIHPEILAQSKVSHFGLASSVVSISNRPMKTLLPKKIMAPLPPIPTMTALPAEMSLEKLLHRRSWWTHEVKIKFSIKLLDLCLQLVKVSRKLFSLKPSQMIMSGLEGNIEIVVRRQFGNTSQQDEHSLLYRAPEVLLGFAESQASYVWSAGILLDQVWHDKLFYKKISEILSRKENFQVRDPSLPIKDLLPRMLHKNQKQRLNLQSVRSELMTLK